jgi:hypothetical protein
LIRSPGAAIVAACPTSDEITMGPRLDAQHAEAVFGIVEHHPFDGAGETSRRVCVVDVGAGIGAASLHARGRCGEGTRALRFSERTDAKHGELGWISPRLMPLDRDVLIGGA